MLKLRKVELLGFKSFCEKTPITFSGTGITCIVGPNGCGKSNVVDAISWVLGEQSHKMLRAERMSDCIFNGTAKRPPMGLAEVTLTLVDPELSEAVAQDADAPDAATKSDMAELPERDGPMIVDALSRPLKSSTAAEVADGSTTRLETTIAAGRLAPRLRSGGRIGRQSKAFRKKRGARKAGHRLEAGRSRGGPAAVPLGPERIPDQRARGAAARRAGNFHGHRSGPGQLRHHRTGPHRADSEFQADGSPRDYRRSCRHHDVQDQAAAGGSEARSLQE